MREPGGEQDLSDLNIFKSYRNRVTYLMKQARQAFHTNFIDENSTDHKRLFRVTKQLLAKKEESSFPNYQDKSKLANDIPGFFVRKIEFVFILMPYTSILAHAMCYLLTRK